MGGEGNIALLHQALRAQIAEWGIDPDKIDPWYFPSVRDYRRRLERAGFGVEQIELIERPTPLPTGIDGWIQSVAHPFLAALSHSDRQKFVSEVEDQVRPSLYDESGTWYADYVRLRFFGIQNIALVRSWRRSTHRCKSAYFTSGIYSIDEGWPNHGS